MIKNYLKIAWRNLTKNKVYSFINISGLAIGLAVCMMIVLFVGHEYSYDRFHKNVDRIVQIISRDSTGEGGYSDQMSYAFAPITKQHTPFVEDFVRCFSSWDKPVIQNPQSASQKFAEPNFIFADSNFFSFFSFKLLEGNKQRVLQNPFTIVISSKIAQKYFGNENAIGKTLRYNDYNFTVTGIADKTPSNSSISYDLVASLSSLSSMKETKDLTTSQRVQGGAFQSYFLLRDAKDADSLESNLKLLSKNDEDPNRKSVFIAMPFDKIHLNLRFRDGSNLKYLKIFPFVAALVLLLAVINYISLSTARSTIRAKEIGVRKVMGANRSAIAKQFFIESTLYTAIAFVFGYILCVAFQPMFFNFLQIDLDKSFLYSSTMLLSFSVLFIITVLLAATYPSLLLSAYKPVMVLYGKFSKKSGGIGIRKFFTVFQFSISILLIICGIVIDRQMYFFRHADTGVNRENVVMISFGQPMGTHYTAFKKDVASLASVETTSTAHYQMYGMSDVYFAKANHSDETVPLTLMNVDENFIRMLGLKWEIFPLDSQYYLSDSAVILNETAIQKMNLAKNPLNENFLMGNRYKYVAGVLKDFNYQSMEDKINPLCLLVTKNQDSSTQRSENGGSIFAKIKPHVNLLILIQQLQNIYQKYDDADPFEYSFMDDAFNAMYKAEERLSKIFSVFTAFTLLIACLGLFGLSAFTALQRTKEIGIRKVLGASVAQITTLLSKDFLKLVMIAILIASPLAWWMMNKWLQTFAYRIHISWWMFIAAAALAMLIAFLTISFQSIKAAVANPVKSLKTE